MNKKAIIEFLKEKGTYHKAFDFNIELLIDQIKLYKLARKSITDDGLNVLGSAIPVKDGGFKVRNQQFKTLSECIFNIRHLSRALGLSVSDSIIFKQLNENTGLDDGFEDGM